MFSRTSSRRQAARSEFEVSLYITAPALGGYRLKILDVKQNALMYPLEINDSLNESVYEIEDEQEYVDALGRILSSEKVQRAINVLISESNAEIGDDDLF